jgi:hypothetical protein
MILFNMERNDEAILLRYEAKPTRMTVSTSVVTIDDDDFARSTIPYIAV